MIPHSDPNDGPGTMKLIEELTTNAGQVQQQVLKEILTGNAHTEYLHGFLNGETDRGLFRRRVPIVDYDRVKPYIERIANGEPSDIISSKPIVELLTSSGTSGGQPKMMPSTEEDLDRKTFMYNLLIPVMNQYVDGLDRGKGMYLLFIKPEISTPSGLTARPVLTSYYKSRHFRDRPFNRFNVYTSPDETILCADSKQSMYCQLLCGLAQRSDVLRVGAVFASAFLRALKFLEDHWEELCSDIRTGTVSEWIADPSCRDATQRVLQQPNPDLAASIAKECAKELWEGIVKRLWPRTKGITVGFDDVRVVGVLLWDQSEAVGSPRDVSYTLLPNMCYYEFIKVEKNEEEERDEALECNGDGNIENNENSNNNNNNNDNDIKNNTKVVDLVDVEEGCYYELVVTTFTGLYRYRVGDILMVTGFHNAAPQFRFVHRRNVVLSVDTDKTSEEDLLNAVASAKLLLRPLGCLLTEYTSYADTSSIPGHYVLFWEIKPSAAADLSNLDRTVMEDCCMAVEAQLDSVYRRCRTRDRSIGPLEIRVVRPSTFDALMDFCLLQGSSVNQYKTPRCIKSKEAIGILEEKVEGRFFSRNSPTGNH
uniref:Indole-3-acetic acid-amido synthetase GH3.17 n=1 Tax=Ananas comosus var. bracteatus TaxID=296719 RepID=A0A6V7NPG3_ANACO|nr:unnamed protein product [Ananas comosus var. bracteatus]